MRKTVVILAVLMTALLLTGAGYAMWADVLWVDGTVNTGEVNTFLSLDGTWDTEPAEKDFSNMTMDYNAGYPMGLVCTISNAYPSIDYYGYFNVENLGTIPVHTDAFYTLYNDLPPGATLEILMNDYMDVDGDGIYWEDWAGWQLHPGDIAWGMVHVHLGDDAAENATYMWTANLEVVQWNQGIFGGQILPRP